MASVGSPPWISRSGAGAWTGASAQARQPYFGRRVTITRNWAGITSSRSDVSSPITCMGAGSTGSSYLLGSNRHIHPRQMTR